jgi:hypothetical protein
MAVSKKISKLLFFCFAMFFSSLAFGEDITISQSLSTSSVALKDFVTFKISVSGKSLQLEDPLMPPTPDFVIFFAGREQTTNPAGVDTVTFSYTFAPKTPGTFTVAEFTINYEGKTFKTQSFEINVIKAEDADRASKGVGYADGGRAFAKAQANKNSVFVNQRLIYTISFYTNMNLSANPLYTAPQFQGFWKDFSAPRTGYTLIDGINYFDVNIKTTLYPSRAGTLNIEPASFNILASLASGKQKEDIIKSNTIKVTVFPLPERNKPENFSGAVGKFSMRAFVDKRKLSVNEPAMFTVAVAGDGNIKGISDPVVEINEQDFRIYDPVRSVTASANADISSKIFRYTIVPVREGRLTIPAAKFSYFDLDKLDYVIVKAAPIDIEVIKGDYQAQVTLEDDIPKAQTDELKEPANIKSLRHKKPALLDSWWLYAIAALFILFTIYGALYRMYINKIDADPAAHRKRIAYKNYKKYYKLAKQALKKGETTAFYSFLNEALYEFIKSVTDKDAKMLLRVKMYEMLSSQYSISTATLYTMDEFFTLSDFYRYTQAKPDESTLAKAETAFKAIVKEMGKK